MSPAQQGRAETHKVRDAVLAITDQLVQDCGNEREGFGVVQTDTTCQATLGEGTELGDNELIELALTLVLWSCCRQ